MVRLFKDQFWVIIIGLAVGLAFLLPQFSFQLVLGDDFQGVYRSISNDELWYMARAQEVVDGHYFLKNPYFLEHKDGLPVQFFLADVVLAIPAKIFKLNPFVLYEFYDFCLPIISFILAFLIFFYLIKDRFWSLFFSLWLLLIQYYDLFNRPVSPQFHFILALLLILLLLKILADNSLSNRLTYLAGFVFGLHFYTYPWHLLFFFSWIVLLSIYFYWHQDRRPFKKILIVLGIGLMIGLPYIVESLFFSRSIVYQELLARSGLIYTRVPSGIQIVVPAFVLAAGYLFFRKKINLANQSIFLSSFFMLALAALVVNVNQHLVTGRNLLFASHYEPIGYFLMAFFLGYLLSLSQWLRPWSRNRIIKMFFVFILLFNFIPRLEDHLVFDASAIDAQRYHPILDWFNTNTEKDVVVLADAELSNLIPAYTHNNVFFSENGGLFYINQSEFLDRFVLNNFWRGENFSYDFVKNNLFSVYGIQYRAQGGKAQQLNKLKKVFGLSQDGLEAIYYPPKNIQAVLDYYHSKTTVDWVSGLEKYSTSYVVLDSQNDYLLPENIDDLVDWPLLFQSDGFKIYRVN